MKRSPKLYFSRWDALVICAVILLAVLSAVTIWGGERESGELTVVISVDGEEVERCLLTELPDMEVPYSANGYTLYVELAYTGGPNYGIQVSRSDCPTQDCVHTGTISRSGQSIVCLPARIIIQLEGGTESGDGPDLVIG
jgi:hypothetical protein